MKRATITVPWREGIHLRPAAQVVKRARTFNASISLKINERMADARSLLGILLLCATVGSVVHLEASGADEEQALASIASVFEQEDPDRAGDGPAGTEGAADRSA